MHSDLPKVLHCLGGKPLLAHVLSTAQLLSPTRICVVDGHGGDLVRETINNWDISWARQEPQLGTGHAVMQALPYLDLGVPTLVLYGDVPMIQADTLNRLKDSAGQGMGILTVTLDDPTGYGRIVRKNGSIVRIVEQKDASEEERRINEINTGVMLIPTQRLTNWLERINNINAQAEYYLTDVVGLAVTDEVPIASVQPAHAWETYGVNSRTQLAELEGLRRNRLAERLMENGVTLADPARIDVRGTLECGRDCEIDVNCIFEGSVVLGNRVSIGPNCILRDVKVGDGTRIEAFSHLNEAALGERCRIGPFARIRPGTSLSQDVHIGNFVEIKASTINQNSKINHLSYVGDSEVGRNVNIGAGTITCNYDGANKYKTIKIGRAHV